MCVDVKIFLKDSHIKGMKYSYLLFYSAIAAVVQGALQDKPPCPRKRGLSEGLTKAENKILNRPLYKLNVKKAAKGFIPETKYRLRIHTTTLRKKFDDAQIFLEALDERCGVGTFILDDPKLFSPKGCPDIAATKTKKPMGRADIYWRAPKCGCVNIRVRVQANGEYFLDDDNREVGPLAKRLCPKDKNLWTYPAIMIQGTREQKLNRLCNLTSQYNATEIAHSNLFEARRNIHRLTTFEEERLETALELRAADIKSCCGIEESQSIECFGDVRRRRIDNFCGTGESDIPLTTARIDWIKQRKSECCWQIGEDRYHCFNHTLYKESMLRDGRIDESDKNDISLDEFDPANDIEDYPIYQQPEKTEKTETERTDDRISPNEKSKVETEDQQMDEVENEHMEKDSDDDNSASVENSMELDVDDDDDDADDDDDDDDDHNDQEKEEVDSSQTTDTERDIITEDITKEDCCDYGITAGARIEDDGLMGCFGMAEKYASLFSKWTLACDRRFVVCCMRVVDALIKRRHGRRPTLRGILFADGERSSTHSTLGTKE